MELLSRAKACGVTLPCHVIRRNARELAWQLDLAKACIWVESLPCGQVRAHGEIYMFSVCQELWHTANMNVKTKKGKNICRVS